VPCYNEEESIPLFYDKVKEIVKDIRHEFIFIDDGSKDKTLSILDELSNNDDSIHYVSFSRNFGKEAGLYAGLKKSKGDYVVVIDVDLQDPPELMLDMINILQNEDYDCVATRRVNRDGEPPIRSFFAKMFYKMINRMSETEIVDGARDYRMMKRIMVDAIINDTEYNRFSKGIMSWVGFKTKWLEFSNRERLVGCTKWSFKSLFKYAMDGILAYSTFPLTLVSYIGLFFFGVSIIALLFIVIRALLFGDPVAGWPSLVSIILFISSLILMCLGIIGLYLSKMYLEIKNRPIYIIRKEK